MWRNPPSTMQKRKWRALETVALAALFAASIVCLARSVRGHEFYTDWQRNDGQGSCCNQIDCAVAEIRRVRDNWEVKLHGHWVPVPQEVILRKNSPDGQAHVCASGVTILCFVEPILA